MLHRAILGMYEFSMRQLQSWTPSSRELSLLPWVNAAKMGAGVESTCDNASLTHSTFKEYVADQDPHIRQILRDTDLRDVTAHLVSETVYSSQHIHTGTDGGLLNGVGTFGFIWGSPSTRSVIATGKGHVPSDEHNGILPHCYPEERAQLYCPLR